MSSIIELSDIEIQEGTLNNILIEHNEPLTEESFMKCRLSDDSGVRKINLSGHKRNKSTQTELTSQTPISPLSPMSPMITIIHNKSYHKIHNDILDMCFDKKNNIHCLFNQYCKELYCSELTDYVRDYRLLLASKSDVIKSNEMIIDIYNNYISQDAPKLLNLDSDTYKIANNLISNISQNRSQIYNHYNKIYIIVRSLLSSNVVYGFIKKHNLIKKIYGRLFEN